MAPQRIYYPGVTIALGLRFDEALHVMRETQTPTNEISRLANDPNADLTAANFRALVSQTIPSAVPLFISTPSDALSWLVHVVPRSAEFSRPGHAEAGTFSATIGHHELPIDPCFVKAAQVRFFVGTIDPADFAKGVTEVISIGGGRTVRRSIVQGIDIAGQSISEKLALWGVIDRWKVRLSDNPTLEISGRDLRSIFMSTHPLRGALSEIDLSQPIDDVVREIVKQHPLGAYFNVEIQPADWPNGVPSPGTADNVTRVNLGAKPQTRKGGKSAVHRLTPGEKESKLDYWQVLCNYCFLVGAVPYIRGSTITIRPPRSMYDLRDKAVFDPTIQTPFSGGAVRQKPDGQPFAIRKIIYGHNVEFLDFERTMQGVNRPKVIEVASLDTSSDKRGAAKLLRAVYPKDVAEQLKKKHVTKESPSGQLGENEVRRIPIPGIRNQAQLEEIARAIFESTARFEIRGSFVTKDLASYMGKNPGLDPNDDADLLHLEVGDPVEFSLASQRLGSRGLANSSPIVSDATALDGMPFEQAVTTVRARLGNHPGTEDLARAIVATRRDIVVETQSIYRISRVSYHWNGSGAGGLKVTADFHNFIEARYGENGQPPAPQALKSKRVGQAPGPGTSALPPEQQSAVSRGAKK